MRLESPLEAYDAIQLLLACGSFRLAAIPSAVAGTSSGHGIGARWLFGHPFGFMAIVETMGKIGVEIHDSMLLLAALRDNPAVRSGDRQATPEVVFCSSRNIFATTFTSFAGFLPLTLERGRC